MPSSEAALMSVQAAHRWLQAAELDIAAASASLVTLEGDVSGLPGPGSVSVPTVAALKSEITSLEAGLIRVVGEIERRCEPLEDARLVLVKAAS